MRHRSDDFKKNLVNEEQTSQLNTRVYAYTHTTETTNHARDRRRAETRADLFRRPRRSSLRASFKRRRTASSNRIVIHEDADDA